ncbi:MAG: arginine--tRNA ligase [Proteobacteria bacterium]|nr:MAG: arginine--tRNA ligase [Pseudomonadota bacterium]
MLSISAMNLLTQQNLALSKRILETKQVVDRRRSSRPPAPLNSYTVHKLKVELADLLQVPESHLNLDIIDRKKFKADLALTSPSMIKEVGNKEYIAARVPEIVERITGSRLHKEGVISAVTAQGMYVNLNLGEKFLIGCLAEVESLGESYGHTDICAGQSIVCDYPSPNCAKHLHAGHIRSTILGHIICNLFEAIGGTAYRIDHLNDWGGFGALIEGYKRWAGILPEFANKNELLYQIYSIVRLAERTAESELEYQKLEAHDLVHLVKFVGEFRDRPGLKTSFESFMSGAAKRFNALERGEKSEVELWQQMVAWSLQDFRTFYDKVGIHTDFVIGESFYAAAGTKLVDDKVASKEACLYTSEVAAKDKANLRLALEKKEISEKVYENLLKEIDGDVGAVVIPLSNFHRYVVRRSDGSSLYSTRDLACIKHRYETFRPAAILYVVGQEQADHFNKLFEATRLLRLCGDTPPEFKHIFFGLYIDADTKKRFSSREGAQGVDTLISQSVAYFKSKYDTASPMPEEEQRATAHKLAIGSIIFNDIKRDMKSPVEFSRDIDKTMLEFEQSGGAYVMYSVCRANAILRKLEQDPPAVQSLSDYQLDDIEIAIIKSIMHFPRKVIDAAKNYRPSVLVEFMSDLAQLYNSYYTTHPVLKGGQVHWHRVIITRAVADVLKNALSICQIDCPERI